MATLLVDVVVQAAIALTSAIASRLVVVRIGVDGMGEDLGPATFAIQ
jgi:hypothetical protein